MRGVILFKFLWEEHGSYFIQNREYHVYNYLRICWNKYAQFKVTLLYWEQRVSGWRPMRTKWQAASNDKVMEELKSNNDPDFILANTELLPAYTVVWDQGYRQRGRKDNLSLFSRVRGKVLKRKKSLKSVSPAYFMWFFKITKLSTKSVVFFCF